jgi:hypothetical protein
VLAGAAAREARADLADELEAGLNNLRGDEFPGTVSSSVSGVNITVDLLGFAFCTPPDPTAPPVTSHVPPLNVYGCQNAAEVTAGAISGDTLTVAVSVEQLFADLYMTRDRTFLCGEFGSGTESSSAYLLTSVLGQARIRTELLEGCTVYRLVPGSIQLTMGSLYLESTDTCASLVASFIGFLEPFFLSQLRTQIESILGTLLRQRNHDLCGEVAGRATSWGSLKAEFDDE